MKLINKILLATTLLFSTQTYATVYEDAEDKSTNKWSVYDKTPAGAYLDNVYNQDRGDNVIESIGSGTSNGYILGNWENRDGAWSNTTEQTLKWSMKFDEAFVVYVRVMTKNGARYIYYTSSKKSYGKNNNYIHIGLGEESNDGTWQDFSRNLASDLKKYEPNNELIAVNAFLVRGSGMVDDVLLSADSINKSEENWYKPTLNSTWQIQLSGEVNTEHSVDIYDIDLFDTSKDTIDLLHNQGKKVICYFSAGSYEDWRSDASDFSADALGNKLDGWDEQWLDIRNNKLKNVMKKRMDLAKAKGCDGVDPDNVDGYTNDTGFNLRSKDQLDYAKFLANEAHKRGLSIGLKNNLDQITELVSHYDFAVNEQCNQYEECDMLNPFIKHSKPVFNIEYSSSYKNDENKKKQLCQKMKLKQISTSILPMSLNDSFRISCEK